MSLPKKRIIVAVAAYAIICIIATAAIPEKSKPLNLSWGKAEKSLLGRPEIPYFKYMFGSPGWGQIHYIGTEDISGMTNEMILYYAYRKLSSVLLILGSGGLNEDNCIRNYKQVVGLLNKKYGHFKYRTRTTDPLKSDLLFSRECNAIRAGLEVIATRWTLGNFRVESFLFGDESDIFIEIEYIFLHLEAEEKKSQQKEDLKRL